MPILLILFILSPKLGSADPLDRPDMILSESVGESTLSPVAKRTLQARLRNLPLETLTVGELSRQRTSYLNLRLDLVKEILEYLSRKGLRLNLTGAEINHFRKFGRLPPITGESEIRVLCISFVSEQVLDKLGIRYLRDIRTTSLAELMYRDGMGKVRIKELEEAFRRVGYPIFANEEERRCAGRLY